MSLGLTRSTQDYQRRSLILKIYNLSGGWAGLHIAKGIFGRRALRHGRDEERFSSRTALGEAAVLTSAGRPFDRSEKARKSRPATFGPAKPSPVAGVHETSPESKTRTGMPR